VDRPQVRGDVLADDPVAARRALREAAVDVGEVHGEPVDLQLARVVDALAPECLADPLIERAQLLLAERVPERQHRCRVAHRREALGRRHADALRRRVGIDELGLLGLEAHELAQERVVLLVADRRRVEDVVLVVRLLDRRPQLSGAAREVPGGHGGTLAAGGSGGSGSGSSRQGGPDPLRAFGAS
jgi:hypothetical protein